MTFSPTKTTLAILAAEAVGLTLVDARSYAIFAAAGGAAGLARFLRSTKAWKWRVVFGYTLFGSLASVVVIGLFFGNDIHSNPWKCLAYSIAIGFGQPELAEKVMVNLLKAFGVNIEVERKP